MVCALDENKKASLGGEWFVLFACIQMLRTLRLLLKCSAQLACNVSASHFDATVSLAARIRYKVQQV